jgi:tRNA 5-methylaminomethyl-2-thiouridine biosynthesis bifunctional protein
VKPLEYKYLKPAAIVQNQDQVFSDLYQDIYFNTENGLEETEYVFLTGNELTQQWQDQQGKHFFCIAETGFGSGLNFLATCQAWQRSQQKPKHLHFISTELHPLSTESLKKIHQQFPELNSLSRRLIEFYGSLRAGFHRFKLTDDITLTLLLGDVIATLGQLKAVVDAWYLDGFAPSRNPQMWTPKLFEQIARLSKQGTTFATFSAAAVVKKGLKDAGFVIQKKPGYGRKRDMLIGHYAGTHKPKTNKQPWHPLPAQESKQQSITIVGGGIAGMCLARSFHQAGFSTTIIDSEPRPLQQASGNGFAMVMPLLTAQKSNEALFYLRAFEYAQRAYGTDIFHPIGVREWTHTALQQKRAKSIANLKLPQSLFQFNEQHIRYPSAGYVDGQTLTERWLKYIDNWLHTEISTIKPTATHWQIFNQKGQLVHQSQTLVIAAGMNSSQLITDQGLSLTAKLGQTNQLITQQPLPISEVQLNDGYIIPAVDNPKHYLIGATFDHFDSNHVTENDYSQTDHLARNLSHWQNSPFSDTLVEAEHRSSHTAVRATTPDHLPICGPVIKESQFKIAYHDLHHGRHWQQYPSAPVTKNLYVMTGLGSRGFTSAPLLADYLMSMITGQPLPLEADLCKIIHPNRFNYRQLKKGQ